MMEAELLAAIAAEPTAIEPYAVYADWLIDRGDPRGELIQLSLAVERGLHDAEIERRLDELSRDPRVRSPRLAPRTKFLYLRTERGFIRAARLRKHEGHQPDAETVHALFAEPLACLLEELSLVEVEKRSLFKAVFGDVRPRIRTLELARVRSSVKLEQMPNLEHLLLYRHDVPAQLSHRGLRRLDATWLGAHYVRHLAEAFPALESLSADDDDLGALAHPRVRRLRCTGYAASRATFELPLLDELDVYNVHVAIVDAPDSMLRRPLPMVQQLRLEAHVPEYMAYLVAALARSPLAAQLRSLALARHDDAAIDKLVECASAFPRLQSLRLGARPDLVPSTEVAMNASVTALRTAFPTVELFVDLG